MAAKLKLGFTPELLKHVLEIFRAMGGNLNFIQMLLEIFRAIGGNLNFIQVLFLIDSVSSSTIYSCWCEKLVLSLFAGCECWFVVSHRVLGDFPSAVRT